MVAENREKKYLAGLMAFLCVATFLEGFDFFIVSLIIDLFSKDFGISNKTALFGVAIINIGAILGFFLVRLGDRIGRKPLFVMGLAGFGLMSLATSFSANFYMYIALQFVTKMFLVTEFNIAIVMVAEEFPSHVRGTAVSVLEVAGGLGGGAAMLISKYVLAAHGWRGMYWIGGAPLIVAPFAFLYLKETLHFINIKEKGENRARALFHIWTTPSAPKALLAGSLWFLCYICYAGLIYHWVLFATTERGWTHAQVGFPMFVASTLGMLGYIVSGAMMDKIGRRKTGVFFFLMSAVSLATAFTAHGSMMMPTLIAAVFFIFALLPVCSTYNAELFPTELRADASAWCNFLMGRPAQVAAPSIVALISTFAGGIGNAVALLSIAPFIAAFIVLKYLPETKGISLHFSPMQVEAE